VVRSAGILIQIDMICVIILTMLILYLRKSVSSGLLESGRVRGGEKRIANVLSIKMICP
jgi:hypothetical protein